MDLQRITRWCQQFNYQSDCRYEIYFINQYNLFAGLKKMFGLLKNFQEYLYHVYGITKWISNMVLQQYYDEGFATERRARSH